MRQRRGRRHRNLQLRQPPPHLLLQPFLTDASVEECRRGTAEAKVELAEGGHPCDETKARRKSTVLFECPEDWASAALDRLATLASVVETDTCEYVFLVETVLACAHPLLLPKRPRDVHQAIKCTRRLE